MPLLPPIPEKPQHGAGKFESNNAFNGLAGLRFSWETAIGWLLPNLGVKLGQVPAAKGSGPALDPAATAALFASGTEAVLGQIGKGLTATQSGVVDDGVTTAIALNGMAASIAQGARDTHAVKKHVQRRTAPTVIFKYVKPNTRALIAPYVQRTNEAEARAKQAAKETADLRRRIARLERQQKKLDSAVIGDLPGRIGLIDIDVRKLKGQVGRLGKWVTAGGILVLLAKALEKMGGSWIRCSNVKRYGRGLCGMNQNLLEGLLADALLVVSVVSVVDLAKALQGIEGEVVSGIRKAVREI